MVRSLVYWTHYSFVLYLGGHRYASPTAFSIGTLLIKRDLLHLQVSSPQGLVLQHISLPYISLSDFPFDVW